jgi:hypothetical protein
MLRALSEPSDTVQSAIIGQLLRGEGEIAEGKGIDLDALLAEADLLLRDGEEPRPL